MITTPALIDLLAASAAPVRRLRPPLVRAAFWLLFAAVVLALVVAGHGLRPDLFVRWHRSDFVISTAAALATGVLAAIAAFVVAVPGRSSRWLLLPLPALATWLASIGYGCLTDWIAMGPDGLRAGETARCFALMMLTALPLALVIFSMLRRVAPLQPRAVALVASLAVAGLTATGLSLFHQLDATALILLLNLGTAALIVVAGTLGGGRLVHQHT